MADEASAMSKVKMISKTSVKPTGKVSKKDFPLVTFDLPYLAFYYNQKLLFYNNGDNFENAVSRLIEALGLVLETYFELAGRLARSDDGVFTVEYDEEMEGVEVSVATADEIGVEDQTSDVDPPPISFKDLVPYNGVLNIQGLHRPLLAVQLTKLRDGLAIGCAFNHAILDGTSTWHFMNAWAHICCNGPNSIHGPPPPFLDRTKARDKRLKLSIPTSNGSAAPTAKPSPPLRERIFRFSESAIDAIKSKINTNTNTKKAFSTFQCLSSHVWRAVTRARRLREDDITVFTVFVDCRRRLAPPLPETYFGNLIHAVFAASPAGNLSDPEVGAMAIRDAIEKHDSAAIEKRNVEWEANPVMLQYQDAGTYNVAVGSSPRFDVYGVDFGWGAPASVRSGSNNRFDGMVYLYSGKSGGRSVDVEISLESAAMGRLEEDEEFMVRNDDIISVKL